MEPFNVVIILMSKKWKNRTSTFNNKITFKEINPNLRLNNDGVLHYNLELELIGFLQFA